MTKQQDHHVLETISDDLLGRAVHGGNALVRGGAAAARGAGAAARGVRNWWRGRSTATKVGTGAGADVATSSTDANGRGSR